MVRPRLVGNQACRSRSRRHSWFTSRGFTLIELLVVISIIALLISILIPSLSRARAKAKMLKCLTNVRGLGQAGILLANDQGGYFQLAASEDGIRLADRGHSKYMYGEDGEELLAWPVALAKYSGATDTYKNNWEWGVRADDWEMAQSRENYMDADFELATCPSDLVRISTPYYPALDSLGDLPSQPQLPDGDRYWGYLSFGINEDVVGAEDRAGPNADAPDCWMNDCRGQIHMCAGERLRGNVDRVFDPASCLLLTDAGPDTETQAIQDPDGFANLILSAQANGPLLADFQVKWRRRMPLQRHPDSRVNVMFTDFHGESARPIEFYETEAFRGIPRKYDTNVRISPYRPYKTQ